LERQIRRSMLCDVGQKNYKPIRENTDDLKMRGGTERGTAEHPENVARVCAGTIKKKRKPAQERERRKKYPSRCFAGENSRTREEEMKKGNLNARRRNC